METFLMGTYKLIENTLPDLIIIASVIIGFWLGRQGA